VSQIAVVGSLNCDLVVRAARQPKPGETLTGESYRVFVGGKGTNQAIAAARAGAQVSILGRIGRDAFGEMVSTKLDEAGVDTSHLVLDSELSTGVAHILVDDAGENSIVIVPQANGRFSPADVDHSVAVLARAKVVLLQLEIPIETVIHAAKLAKANGATVLLNPAPAPPSGGLPRELCDIIDILVPNQSEATLLTGVDADTLAGGRHAAEALLRLGFGGVVLTMGALGAVVATEAGPPFLVGGFAVEVVDTTAAGDAFCGAMAASLARGVALSEAVRAGNAAGALACTRLGAEPSLPSRSDIERLMQASSQ